MTDDRHRFVPLSVEPERVALEADARFHQQGDGSRFTWIAPWAAFAVGLRVSSPRLENASHGWIVERLELEGKEQLVAGVPLLLLPRMWWPMKPGHRLSTVLRLGTLDPTAGTAHVAPAAVLILEVKPIE